MPELAPRDDEIVVVKTTDSALTGTSLRLVLRNVEIDSVIVSGIFADQCVSSTVRSLADQSFDVIVVEDCCAAATTELHMNALKIINMIYCHAVTLDDVAGFFVVSTTPLRVRRRLDARRLRGRPQRCKRAWRRARGAGPVKAAAGAALSAAASAQALRPNSEVSRRPCSSASMSPSSGARPG